MRVRVDYPPKFGRRLCEKILSICSQIPPKLSNMIISSSTPNEWSRSSIVFDSSERPCNKELAWLVGVAGVLPLPKNRQIFGSPVWLGTSAVLQWCPRLCLICSTHWALRTIWWCLMILAVAANNAFGYQGKRYAIGCLDSCKRILVVRARVHICMVCLESIFWLRRHHPIYVPWKLGEKFLVKEIFSMIL